MTLDGALAGTSIAFAIAINTLVNTLLSRGRKREAIAVLFITAIAFTAATLLYASIVPRS